MQKENSNNPDFLANTFAQFGIDLNEKKEETPVETEENFEIALPDFNTQDHKIKRVLEVLPDYEYLFED